MSGFKLLFFKLYIFLLAVWMGARTLVSFQSRGWYEDPVGYIDHIVLYPIPGATDPFPAIVLCITIITVLCLLLFLRYHGPGKRTAIVSFTATFLVLFVSYIYFIPTYNKLFDEAGGFNPQMISMSRTWIIADRFRLFILILTFFAALLALSKFKSNRH